MIDISKCYNELLDKGIPITELYIYHLIISDGRAYGLNEKEIAEMTQDVINARYDSSESIEDIVDKLFNGDDLSEEEWY